MKQPFPQASVILPAYNEEEHIRRCLVSLTMQETAIPFEVIVVDNGSKDHTVDIAKRFADRLDLRIVHEPRKGRGRARRSGWRVARGAILLSTDADTVLPPNWVDTLCGALMQSKAVYVAGTTRIDDCTPFINTIYNVSRLTWLILTRCWSGHYSVGGAAFAVRRWAYFASGGFDPDVDAHDDLHLVGRLSLLGSSTITFAAPAIVSGRRFRNGFLLPLAEHMRLYAEQFWLKRRLVAQTDIR